MSCYLVDPKHIAELVKWAFSQNSHGVPRTLERMGAESVAVTLAQANIDSVSARYPSEADDICKEFSGLSKDEYIGECKSELKKSASGAVALFSISTVALPDQALKACDIWKMASCLDYQSCEVQGWEQSPAFNIISAIQRMAGESMCTSLSQGKQMWSYPQRAHA